MILVIILMNFVVVTLPILKKSKLEPEMDANDNPVYEDAKADENGNIPEEPDVDDEGNPKLDDKGLPKMKKRMVDRALRIPWVTCKAIMKPQEDEGDEGDKKADGQDTTEEGADETQKENTETKNEDDTNEEG